MISILLFLFTGYVVTVALKMGARLDEQLSTYTHQRTAPILSRTQASEQHHLQLQRVLQIGNQCKINQISNIKRSNPNRKRPIDDYLERIEERKCGRLGRREEKSVFSAKKGGRFEKEKEERAKSVEEASVELGGERERSRTRPPSIDSVETEMMKMWP
nr:hypothetical protein Iba_chr14aCG27760 [Ipomoea batatas]